MKPASGGPRQHAHRATRKRAFAADARVSFCRKTCVKLTVWSMHSFQAAAWNANDGLEPFVTGGSWKKSPVTTSCRRGGKNGQEGNSRRGEANGQKTSPGSHQTVSWPLSSRPSAEACSRCTRACRTTDRRPSILCGRDIISVSSLVRVVPLQSERRCSPSSMTRTLTRCHLVLAVLFLMTLLTSWSGVPTPSPIPAKE